MCPIFLRFVRPPSGTIETLKSGIIFSAESMRRERRDFTPPMSRARVRSSFLSIRMVAQHPEVGQTSQYKRVVGTNRTDELITSGCPLFGRDFGRQVAAPLT
jgi:hypothetical protein